MLKQLEKEVCMVDLDGVIYDFNSAWDALPPHERFFENDEKKVPHEFFLKLPLIDGAVDAIRELSSYYDLYFLSTPQWSNPDSWSQKRLAVL